MEFHPDAAVCQMDSVVIHPGGQAILTVKKIPSDSINLTPALLEVAGPFERRQDRKEI